MICLVMLLKFVGLLFFIPSSSSSFHPMGDDFSGDDGFDPYNPFPDGPPPAPGAPGGPPIMDPSGVSNRMMYADTSSDSEMHSWMCEMLLSKPTPPSISEVPTSCLCSYCKGMEGPKGQTGDQGPPGAVGSPGRRGIMGYPGRPGYTGPDGLKGQKGTMGEKGLPGPAGFTGMKGMRGFKGEKGEGGSMGPAGSQGPQGETGSCPATCDSHEGPPGEQGPPGPTGSQGLTGVQGTMGSKGMKGDKGDMGVPGGPGTTGPKGDTGDQGLCDCMDGSDGADGTPGATGMKGDKGDMGVPGVQGNEGPKGDVGAMGHMGIPGPCSPAVQSAFSACLEQSFPAPNWPVVFPKILLNLMGNFDASMGIYTAPVNGTYVFSFHLTVLEKPLVVGLFVNRDPIVKVTETTQYSIASQTVVQHLTVGDMVRVQVKSNVTNGAAAGHEISSTFSGYLLFPDMCGLPLGRGSPMTHEFKESDFEFEPENNYNSTYAMP